jgi:hypothetical protein
MGTGSLISARTATRRMQEIAQMLHSQGIFTGGPPQYFEIVGRLQLATLLREGIYRSHQPTFVSRYEQCLHCSR